MKTTTSQVTKLVLTDLDRLDPVSVITEDFGSERGKIIIECYGKAWTAYWGSMGCNSVAIFFYESNEHYLAGKLSNIDDHVYDIDAIRESAEEKGIECWRDDPWHDHEFLHAMYGPDMTEWHNSLPKKSNSDYLYLCRIIKAVQEAFRNIIAEHDNSKEVG